MPAPLNPELSMIREFIGACLPFTELAKEQLERLCAEVSVIYLPRETVVVADDGAPTLRIIRAGAVDIVSEQGVLLERLGEQESFNINGLAEDAPGVKAVVTDDALIYCINGREMQALRKENRSVDRYFQGQRARRLRRAARYTETRPELLTPIYEVVRRHVVAVEQTQSIRHAAMLMTENRISSLLVMDGVMLVGIVTDRDIRSRVVAVGLDISLPVAEIMSADPQVLDLHSTLFDAMMLMSEKGFHHLPVVETKTEGSGGNSIPVSVITTSDLVRIRQRDPIYLLQAIARSDDVAKIAEVTQELPALVLRLVSDGARADQVSRFLCAISDRITQRLLELAERQLGPAPTDYAWLGFGSQGRREIALGGDQDNALVIANELDESGEEYFSRLARFVCDGLNACGYPYCPGEVMATNPQWRLRLRDWKNTVSGWVRSPTDDAVMRVSIFYDIRCIFGSVNLAEQLQQHMLNTASTNSIFLAALARNALCSRPPLGFFRRFVVERNGEHQDMLDLKRRGIIPVVELARVNAIANAITRVNTLERFSALAAAKKMALKDARNLQDALNFVMQIRLEHQCQQIRDGQTPDNFINPKQLGSLSRSQLRDAFALIHEAQETLAMDFSGGSF